MLPLKVVGAAGRRRVGLVFTAPRSRCVSSFAGAGIMAGGAQAGEIIHDNRALQIAAAAKRVAVLGIKTEAQASQPAYFVPEYLARAGVDVVPVPTYYPDVASILGRPVVRDLRAVGAVDILDVFRRPADLPAHLDDILAMAPRPGCVWLQSGISNPEFERALSEAGIVVVVSRCLKVDHAASTATGGRAAL